MRTVTAPEHFRMSAVFSRYLPQFLHSENFKMISAVELKRLVSWTTDNVCVGKGGELRSKVRKKER